MNTSVVQESQQETGAWSDREILTLKEDRFGFRDYAKVLAQLARNADTPISIGIFGEWGSGKTSLMRLIQYDLSQASPSWFLRAQEFFRQLWLRRGGSSPPNAPHSAPSRPGKVHNLWVNIWQLSNRDELWNAFLQALFTSIRREMPTFKRLAFNLRLLRERIDFGNILRQLLTNSYRILIVITPLLLQNLWPTLLPKEPNDFLRLILDPITGGGASLILGIWLLVKPVVEAAHEKVSLDLGKMLKESPYEVQITALQQLQGQFERLVRYWVGQNGRLVIFVDDIDRAEPERVPEVLESLKLFTTTQRCVYIIGLDFDVVRQGIRKKYQLEQDESAEYLEKIIQIPFNMPPLAVDRIEDFVNDYYSELNDLCPTAPHVFAAGLEPNPRKVKRALNIYRALLDLGEIRVRNWEMDSVDPELLAKMVILQTRFRKLHNHLIANPSLLTKLQVEARRRSNHAVGFKFNDSTIKLLSGDSDKSRLVDPDDLDSLGAMLSAGEAGFGAETEGQSTLLSYIYLIGFSGGANAPPRPRRSEREKLLSPEPKIVEEEAQVILDRLSEGKSRSRSIQDYRSRLAKILEPDAGYTPSQISSARLASVLFTIAAGMSEKEAFEQASREAPEDAYLHWRLATLYEQSDANSAAEKERQQAYLYDPTNPIYKDAVEDQRREQAAAQRPTVRSLFDYEITEARRVFGNGLDYRRVRIHENARYISVFNNLGMRLKGMPQDIDIQTSFALGNHCYFSTRLKTLPLPDTTDGTDLEIRDTGWLINQLTSVWQYQHVGWGYFIRKLRAQFSERRAYDYGGADGLRERYKMGLSFKDFNLEQQADIARDYYLNLKHGKDVAPWEPFIAEFQIPD